MTLHPGVWLGWLLAGLVVASSSIHPIVTLGTVAAAVTVACSLGTRSDRGPLRITAALGGIFLVFRVVLFTLTGRAGSTTLVELPELVLPGFLGGIRFGGELSAEVFAAEVGEGFRLFAILIVTGAFASVADLAALVRLVPRRLRHVAVVVQVAVAFLPALAASAREVREAQSVRGLRLRGPRSAAAIVVPVLAGALDRAFALAESLHARGFDRPGNVRVWKRPLTVRDRRVALGLLAAAVSAVAWSDAAGWSPYPVLSWPAADPLLLVAPFLLTAPVFVLVGRRPVGELA